MPAPPHSAWRSFLRSREFGVLVILLAFMAVLEATSRAKLGQTFWTLANLPRVTQMYAYMAIATMGAAVVLISGGVDLSSGSAFGLGAVVTLFLFHPHGRMDDGTLLGLGWAPLPAVMAAVAAGAAVGLVNGLLVAKARITPFIVTLGMLSVAKGLQMWVCGGINIALKTDPGLFNFIRAGTRSGDKALVPGVVWVFLPLAAALSLVLARFAWGRSVYAIGGNEEVARHSGIAVDRVKAGVYVLAAALAALGGSFASMCNGYAGADVGRGYELQFIAGVVVGGTSLSGGRGSILGAALGAGVLQLLTELLLLYNVSGHMQYVTYGGVILLAAGFDELRTRGGLRALGRLFH